LADGGFASLVDGVGDSYDKALTENINDLSKAEVIQRRGSLRTLEAVETSQVEVFPPLIALRFRS